MAAFIGYPSRAKLTELQIRFSAVKNEYSILNGKYKELTALYSELLQTNRELEETIEKLLNGVRVNYSTASALMSPQAISEALILPKLSVNIKADTKNIAGIEIPKLNLSFDGNAVDIYPYGFLDTAAELDFAVKTAWEALPLLVKYAETEKVSRLIHAEIIKIKRKIEVLKYDVIPELENELNLVSVKTHENEDIAQIRYIIKKQTNIGDI